MAFMNFLSNIGAALPAIQQMLPPGSSPGFAGGHFGGIPQIDEMGGINEALARNQQMAKPQKQKLGFADIVGALADAARGWKGQEPIYGPQMLARRKEQSRNQALSNYLDDPEGAIRALFAAGDPETALAVMKARQGAEPPADVQTYQWRQKLPENQRADFDKFMELKRFNPYGAPIVLNQGDVFEPAGGQPQSSGPMTATNPETGERVQFNPQTNQWEPMGGAPASPAPTFP